MEKVCPDVPLPSPSEREWLPVPRFRKLTSPAKHCGFAEIKPHNLAGIRHGLKQLGSPDGHGRKGRTGYFLVTYLPVNGTKPTGTGRPKNVRVFATPYYSGKKTTSSDKKKKAKDVILDWHWHDLGSITPEKDVSVVVDRAALFGVAIEDDVRKLFQKVILEELWKKKKTSYGGGAHLHGADIYWTELARFYSELARELGDPFYADLASELASFSRETVDWDAA